MLPSQSAVINHRGAGCDPESHRLAPSDSLPYWLTGGLAGALLQRWNGVPDGWIGYGAVGIVIGVRRENLPSAVLKISYPHPGIVHEPDALTAWAGRGAVQLFERDSSRFAMLLERADVHSLADVLSIDEAVTAAGRVCRRLAVPAPPALDGVLPRLGDRSRQRSSSTSADGKQIPKCADCDEGSDDRGARVGNGPTIEIEPPTVASHDLSPLTWTSALPFVLDARPRPGLRYGDQWLRFNAAPRSLTPDEGHLTVGRVPFAYPVTDLPGRASVTGACGS